MRLWSLHPQCLDAKGLVALWREALLAQKVLQNATNAYTNHPQLIRFKSQSNPLELIGAYLAVVAAEAKRRGYHFDASKIEMPVVIRKQIPVTDKQIAFESLHLRRKLKTRARPDNRYPSKKNLMKVHPLFEVIPGRIEAWEKVK